MEVTQNFIRQMIEDDLASGKYTKIVTRFPPEPNGYLHVGHAKSIFLNFGLAKHFGGQCHLRFDDTNPETENQTYIDAICDVIEWLGFDSYTYRYYASDYFSTFYDAAVLLIQKKLAYVDHSSMVDIQKYRGSLTQVGEESPFRTRSVQENLSLFEAMKNGKVKEGECVLRLKIDMSSPNMNMRDPIIYRIRYQAHHRTGKEWCIYPMYDYAHCISDAIEGITHSICTLEFEDHRPLYDWILLKLQEFGMFPNQTLPKQIEYARLNLTYTVTSKRKLLSLLEHNKLASWDDPRMPTLIGMRRRGYPVSAIRDFCQRIGVTKADSWIDFSYFEECVRDHLLSASVRRLAIIDPVPLVIENMPDDLEMLCQAHCPIDGDRPILWTKHLWVERDDVQPVQTSNFYRLSPGQKVRLKYGYIVTCSRVDVDENNRVTCVYVTYDQNTLSGTEGANQPVKGVIHWLSQKEASKAIFKLYTHLLDQSILGAEDDLLDHVAIDSCTVLEGYVEPALSQLEPETTVQCERLGYFVADRYDYTMAMPMFNRIVSLKAGKKRQMKV